VAVEAAATMPLLRPLVGMDKMEILALARKIGTYEISSEPFHDCCPVFLPRSPELSATPNELVKAEEGLDIESLVAQGIRGATLEKFSFEGGKVEATEPLAMVPADQQRAAKA